MVQHKKKVDKGTEKKKKRKTEDNFTLVVFLSLKYTEQE